jgi:hypothetical protein
MTKSITILSVLIGIIAIGIISFGTVMHTYNSASQLKNVYDMKISANAAEFDNMWKKIREVSQIPEQKKKAFQEIFAGYAESRNSGSKSQLMTWVQEAVPNLDLSVYDQLINIIAGSRDTWTMKQTELVSIAEQYNQKLVVFPSNIILGIFGFQKIDPKIITSTRTQEAFASGVDDEVGLFNK